MTTTRHTMQQLVDALLDKGVHVDPEHPHRVALTEAQAWLAQPDEEPDLTLAYMVGYSKGKDDAAPAMHPDTDPRWAGIDFDLVNAELRDYRSQIEHLRAQIGSLAPVVANADGYVDAELGSAA